VLAAGSPASAASIWPSAASAAGHFVCVSSPRWLVSLAYTIARASSSAWAGAPTNCICALRSSPKRDGPAVSVA
jgi:hypothetical protein